MRILVVHNPNAGHDELSRDVLTQELQRAGHVVSWFERGTGKLSDALSPAFDAVVVAGGDGSVGAVGRQLAGRPVPVAILPLGTANNVATVLGATASNLIQRLEERRVVAFDVGVIEGTTGRRLFLEGVGRGPFADTVALLESAEHGQPNGREDELERDLSALRRSVMTSDACDCHLEIDGEELAGRFLMIEITNAGLIGPNLLLSPGAVPFDGLLDLFVVKEAERGRLLELVIHQHDDGVPATAWGLRQARRVRFRAPRGQQLHIDGEVLVHESALDIRIELQAEALQFFVTSEMRWD